MPTILITGASRGIGLELVRLCLKRGDRVLATHRPGPDVPRALADLVAAYPGHIRLIPIDLANISALANLSSRLAERIDVLINSASVVVDIRADGEDGNIFYEGSYRAGSVNPVRVAGAVLSNMTRGSKIVTVSVLLGYASAAASGEERRRIAGDEIMLGFAADLKPLGIAVTIVEPEPPRPEGDDRASETLAVATAVGVLDVADRLDLAHSGNVFRLEDAM